MLAYVLDAWAEHGRRSRAAATAGRRLLARRRGRDRGLRRPRRRSRSRTSRAAPGTRSRAALAAVPEDAVEVLVLSGDVPLVTGADLDAVLEARRQDDAAIALASVFAADPAELGRVVRGEFGTVERIVEAKDATDDELAVNEINAGLYAFDAAWLRRRIGALDPSPATGELYLTDLVRLAREDGRIVSAITFDDDGRFDGINDRSPAGPGRVGAARAPQRARTCADGVTMRDPSTVYLDWDVELAPDVELEPNVDPPWPRRRSARAPSSAPARS